MNVVDQSVIRKIRSLLSDDNMANFIVIILALLLTSSQIEAGIVKDLIQRVTGTGNKTEKVVKQSIPVCGASLFSTESQDKAYDSNAAEIIFITNQASKSNGLPNQRARQNSGRNINEVAAELRFSLGNVSTWELERYGFNRDAPITFLIHGFTSGYPLQGWMTAIVESYTINREVQSNSPNRYTTEGYTSDQYDRRREGNNDSRRNQRQASSDTELRRNSQRENSGRNWRDDDRYPSSSGGSRDKFERNNQGSSTIRDSFESSSSGSNQNYQSYSSGRNSSGISGSRDRDRDIYPGQTQRVDHNLFIINWNNAARGIFYPRAVANIPAVAGQVVRFIDLLKKREQVEPRQIQVVGHSLGAHVAGFIGQNTRVGRIYGLDPAGPCFGAYAGFLYPSSSRLSPEDADEVITIQTNSALLGHDKALGSYSVFVEGGEVQPGCKGGGVLKSLSTLTWDGGDFDTVACSHSRAPNLLTYSQSRASSLDTCEMIAYECKDWDSFVKGFCGLCQEEDRASESQSDPMKPVKCIRIGLDWQYSRSAKQENKYANGYNLGQNYQSSGSSLWNSSDSYSSYRDRENGQNYGLNNQRNRDSDESSRRPQYDESSSSRPTYQGNRRASEERKLQREKVTPVSMFLRTSDTQPFCTFHYQVILELNEPFQKKDPPMSLILQDSENHRNEIGSLNSDRFGSKFNDRIYTQLLTSVKRLGRIDHATILFREGLPQGAKAFKAIHVNHMSHSDPKLRQSKSTKLCPVENDNSRGQESYLKDTRFYFEPCRKRNNYNTDRQR